MVKVAQVTAVGNTQQRTFPARIESGDSTELSFKRGGQVESLDIRQGASVAQGQTLARLNAREAQQRVNERQTAATLAQRQFDRFQTLAGRQAISQAEMDVQRANRDAANAALKIAREELAQMSLIAPFSGIAAGVHIRNHQVVAAGQPVITLTRTDLLDVVFSIPEICSPPWISAIPPTVPSSGSIPCRAASLPRNTKSIPAAATIAPSPGRSC